MKSSAFISFALPAVIATSAFAQTPEPQCVQMEDLICGPRAPSIVARVTGDVLIVRPAASGPASQGARLGPGDRVIVNQGSAIIALGPRCVVQLPANSSVNVIQRGNLACIDKSAFTPGGPPSATPIVGAFVGTFAAGLVAATTGDSDNSPVSP